MIIGGPASSFAGRNVASSSTTAASISSNFEELQRELQAFNELFGLWTEQRRRALLEDKDAYLKTLSEEHDTVEALKKQYQQLIQQKQQIAELLAAEEKERQDYARLNLEYQQQRDGLHQKLATIKRESDLLEGEIMKESKIRDRRLKIRDLNRGQCLADLQLYREKLGIMVEPIEANTTKVTFKHVDPNDPGRVFTFVVDHSEGYMVKLGQFNPALPSSVQQQFASSQPSSDFLRLLGKNEIEVAILTDFDVSDIIFEEPYHKLVISKHPNTYTILSADSLVLEKIVSQIKRIFSELEKLENEELGSMTTMAASKRNIIRRQSSRREGGLGTKKQPTSPEPSQERSSFSNSRSISTATGLVRSSSKSPEEPKKRNSTAIYSLPKVSEDDGSPISSTRFGARRRSMSQSPATTTSSKAESEPVRRAARPSFNKFKSTSSNEHLVGGVKSPIPSSLRIIGEQESSENFNGASPPGKVEPEVKPSVAVTEQVERYNSRRLERALGSREAPKPERTVGKLALVEVRTTAPAKQELQEAPRTRLRDSFITFEQKKIMKREEWEGIGTEKLKDYWSSMGARTPSPELNRTQNRRRASTPNHLISHDQARSKRMPRSASLGGPPGEVNSMKEEDEKEKEKEQELTQDSQVTMKPLQEESPQYYYEIFKSQDPVPIHISDLAGSHQRSTIFLAESLLQFKTSKQSLKPSQEKVSDQFQNYRWDSQDTAQILEEKFYPTGKKVLVQMFHSANFSNETAASSAYIFSCLPAAVGNEMARRESHPYSSYQPFKMTEDQSAVMLDDEDDLERLLGWAEFEMALPVWSGLKGGFGDGTTVDYGLSFVIGLEISPVKFKDCTEMITAFFKLQYNKTLMEAALIGSEIVILTLPPQTNMIPFAKEAISVVIREAQNFLPDEAIVYLPSSLD